MAFQRVPNSAEVTIVYSQNLEPMANVVHAELATGYDFTDISNLAAAVDAAVLAQLRPLMTLDASYLRTEVRGLDTENDLFASVNTSNGPGADAVEGLPTSVTFSIKKESGFTGRSARGRWYVVGIPVNDLRDNENQLTALASVAWTAAVENLRAAINGTAWSPVIVSRFAGGVARAVGVTFPWISVSAVNDNIDTQRRRLTS